MSAIWFQKYHFFSSVHVNLCLSSRPQLVCSIGWDFILSYVFKGDPLCFGFRLINYGSLFYYCCFFQLIFDVCSDVIFSVMLLALSTNPRAFFTCPCGISIESFLVWLFFGFDWFFESFFNCFNSFTLWDQDQF